MRIDAAFAEFLQADAGHEAAARVPFAVDFEFLLIDVQAAGGILSKNAVGDPVAQRLTGPGVAIVVAGVGGGFLAEDQAHDIVRTAVVERLLQARIDHVIRRRDDSR